MATTSVPMNPRPPLPQRALERVSPFEGLPQRALHRSPPFAPRSCRIRPVSSPPRNCAAALGFLTPDRKLGGKGCDHVPLLREKRQIHSFEGLAPERAVQVSSPRRLQPSWPRSTRRPPTRPRPTTRCST